jgi:hypothetical protein
MNIFEIAAALAFAALIGLFFSFVFRIKGPWGRLWSFILVLFLIIWASEIWVSPMGPTLYDIAWLPLLIVGIVTALLLAAVSPRMPRKKTPENQPPTYYGIGIFYWIFVFTIIIIIIAGIFASS